MSLFKRGNKWHFAFRFNGKRYRGSCKTSRAQEARKVESLVLARLLEGGHPPGSKKIPTLADFSNRFFNWLESLPADRPPKPPTRRYYRVGLGAPKIRVHRWYETGSHNDRSRFNHRGIVSRTILLIMLDSGLRPGEIFRMRWENIHWDEGVIFNPRGKSRKSRRYVPLTDRVKAALLGRKLWRGQGT
jgi:integrase